MAWWNNMKSVEGNLSFDISEFELVWSVILLFYQKLTPPLLKFTLQIFVLLLYGIYTILSVIWKLKIKIGYSCVFSVCFRHPKTWNFTSGWVGNCGGLGSGTSQECRPTYLLWMFRILLEHLICSIFHIFIYLFFSFLCVWLKNWVNLHSCFDVTGLLVLGPNPSRFLTQLEGKFHVFRWLKRYPILFFDFHIMIVIL